MLESCFYRRGKRFSPTAQAIHKMSAAAAPAAAAAPTAAAEREVYVIFCTAVFWFVSTSLIFRGVYRIEKRKQVEYAEKKLQRKYYNRSFNKNRQAPRRGQWSQQFSDKVEKAKRRRRSSISPDIWAGTSLAPNLLDTQDELNLYVLDQLHIDITRDIKTKSRIFERRKFEYQKIRKWAGVMSYGIGADSSEDSSPKEKKSKRRRRQSSSTRSLYAYI